MIREGWGFFLFQKGNIIKVEEELLVFFTKILIVACGIQCGIPDVQSNIKKNKKIYPCKHTSTLIKVIFL